MHTMNIDPRVLAGILAYSITVTQLTNWLVAGFDRPKSPYRVSLTSAVTLLANLLWVFLVAVFGVLAVRYVERMVNVIVGYALLGMSGFLLSWIRAYLYRRVQGGFSRRPPDWQGVASVVVHNLTYALFAAVLYLVTRSLLNQPVDPVLLIPLCIGALLPDLDSRALLPGRLIPWISKRLEAHLGHLEEWHTPVAAAFLALVTSPLSLLFGVQAWYLIPLGFLSHLLLDLLAPRGIMLLWPLRNTRYGVFGGVIRAPGCQAERVVAAGLVVIGLLLLFALDLGHPDAPQAPVPSYEQTLEQYYTMRGRSQVFAYLDGSWQTSGMPISGRFEILNARDQSYVVLDRYSGMIFTAGQTSEDNVYLNRVILQRGSSIVIKPVDIHLERQSLGDATDVVYEMQRDPGVQHIYVTGDLVLSTLNDTANSALQADYGQTHLQQIQEHGMGRFSLHFLSAADLLKLADLQVETADLIIVGTYARPATGPTVTPLPPASQSLTDPAQ